MRKLTVFLTMMFSASVLASGAPSAPAPDRVLKGPGVTLHLHQTACSLPIALARLQPEHVSRFRDGEAKIEGQTARLCWTDMHVDGTPAETMIFVLAQDGSSGWVTLDGFREDVGV